MRRDGGVLRSAAVTVRQPRREHGRGQPLVVGGGDGAQVKQQPAALDPADDGRHVPAAHRRT